MWTGDTDMSPEFQKFIQKALISMPFLGIEAYRKVMWAERNWQSVIGTAKTNIVVRSIIVPIANTISGLYQLKVRGVPLILMGRELPKKLAEIEEYTQTLTRKIHLETQLDAESDTEKAGTLRTNIRRLDDQMKNPNLDSGLKGVAYSDLAALKSKLMGAMTASSPEYNIAPSFFWAVTSP